MHASPASPGILLVAFGVTTRHGKPALAAFTEQVRAAFPGQTVRWAFTARHKVKRPTLRGEPGMSVPDALVLFAAEGTTRIAVQPLHLIPGREHAALCRIATAWRTQHPETSIFVGDPLLSDDAAMHAALAAMRAIAPPQADTGEAVVWVGHGSRDSSCARYTRMADVAAAAAAPLYMGHIAGGGNAEAVLARLAATGKKRARLMAFFALSGYHAARDVAGRNENSWKSRFTRAGIDCRVCLRGMVEYEEFAAMWLERLRETLSRFRAGA